MSGRNPPRPIFINTRKYPVKPLTVGDGVGILLTGISSNSTEVKIMEQQRPQQAMMVLVTVVTVEGTRYHVYREERTRQAITERRYSCPCCGSPTKQEYLLCGRCLF